MNEAAGKDVDSEPEVLEAVSIFGKGRGSSDFTLRVNAEVEFYIYEYIIVK